jgi:hypothetical protein
MISHASRLGLAILVVFGTASAASAQSQGCVPKSLFLPCESTVHAPWIVRFGPAPQPAAKAPLAAPDRQIANQLMRKPTQATQPPSTPRNVIYPPRTSGRAVGSVVAGLIEAFAPFILGAFGLDTPACSGSPLSVAAPPCR